MRITAKMLYEQVDTINKDHKRKLPMKLEMQGMNGYWNLYKKSLKGGYWEIKGGMTLRELSHLLDGINWGLYQKYNK